MLTKSQLREFIKTNAFEINKAQPGVGCIEFSQNPKKVAFPGGDIGIISLFLSSATIYGFDLKRQEFLKMYQKETVSPLSCEKDCFYTKNIISNPERFFLQRSDIEFLKEIQKKCLLEKAQKQKEEVFFLIKGNAFVYQKFKIRENERTKTVFALAINIDTTTNFVKKICKQAFEEKIITLRFGLDIEYLSEVVLETLENHLWQSVVNHYKGIPIYQVRFKTENNFEIKEMGNV